VVAGSLWGLLGEKGKLVAYCLQASMFQYGEEGHYEEQLAVPPLALTSILVWCIAGS
jgi:hypothetical protein